ncbi:MarR family transcriptional regulator [[Clostridium] symbiosum]|uniref:MarR family winged helix-turn-helix transcriptional regulator n=1 Tax=Clostridium symbiosum TaxID=1512 RepID=UPI001D0635C9|nr:MarR family transcriptional regulator [[Clostridium] symbiosum]MCB6609902.1 MarR family transcriptional regulator [[Clostridium] symbiosum]MCB6932041.1 MarR family transcriptional regulator [[Clostridium] symbiosum]
MELKECINFLLTTAQHTVFQYLSQRLAPYDITPSQYGILNCLWIGGGTCLPRQIAEMLCLETSTVSGILDRMQKKDLIDRVINPDNRREILVMITPKGEALKEPVLKIIDEVNEEVLKDFSPKETDFIRKSLRQIAEKAL